MNHKFTPADIEFFERISDNVQSSAALPFEIPVDRLPKIILRAAKWFWEWHIDATSEETLYIPSSELDTSRRDHNTNLHVKLPSGIEGILQVHSAGLSAGLTLRDALRIPLLDSYGSTGRTTTSTSSGYTGTHYAVSDSVIAMYEFDMYNNLFRKGTRFNYNKLTNILNVIGNPGGSLILNCFVRVPMDALYQSIEFEDYCTAMCMMELGKVVMSLEFQLPGGVRLNYDQIRSDGQEKKREIEEQIKANQGTPFIFTK